MRSSERSDIHRSSILPIARMPQLLASVRNAIEAALAAQAGADWIDLKNPLAGSLGMAESVDIIDSLQVLNGSKPVSIALGELCELQSLDYLDDLPLAEIVRVKVGLAGTAYQGVWLPEWRSQWQRLKDRLPTSTELVAAHYADWQTCNAPTAEQTVKAAAQIGCTALLIDTFEKCGECLLDHYRPADLATIAKQSKDRNLEFVAAGSLQLQHVRAVVQAGADVVALRGALCEGSQRTGRLSPRRVSEFKQLLDEISSRV